MKKYFLLFFLFPFVSSAQSVIPQFSQSVATQRNAGTVSFGVNQQLGLIGTTTAVSSFEVIFQPQSSGGFVQFGGNLACYNDSSYTSYYNGTTTSISSVYPVGTSDILVSFNSSDIGSYSFTAGKYCTIGVASASTTGLTGELYGLGTATSTFPAGSAFGLNKGSVADYYFKVYTDSSQSVASRILRVNSPTNSSVTSGNTVIFDYDYFNGTPLFLSASYEWRNVNISQQGIGATQSILVTGEGNYSSTQTFSSGDVIMWRPVLLNPTASTTRFVGSWQTVYVATTTSYTLVPPDFTAMFQGSGFTAFTAPLQDKFPFALFFGIPQAMAQIENGIDNPDLPIDPDSSLLELDFNSTTTAPFGTIASVDFLSKDTMSRFFTGPYQEIGDMFRSLIALVITIAFIGNLLRQTNEFINTVFYANYVQS
jgi:hypothetical protein